MIEFQKIALKNVITHKDSAFEFQPGITVVRGDNGAGKSLLFNCIPNIFDSAPPLAKKKDAKILHSDNSAIGFKFNYNNKKYRVIQESSKSSLNYKIEEDGKDLEPRTISIAKEYLERIFPLNTNHYYSLVHLNTYRPHILLSGTGPQRKEFFEELFHLNISDFIGDKVKEDYNVLKRQKDEMMVLKDQINELKRVDNIDELKERYDSYHKEYDLLQKDFNGLSKKLNLLASVEAYRNQLNYPDTSTIEIEKKIKDFMEKLEKMESIKKKIEFDNAKYQQIQLMKEEIRKLNEKLSEYSDVKETSYSLKEEYNELKNKGNELKKKKVEIEATNKKYNEMKELEKLVAEENKSLSYEQYLRKVSVAENEIEQKENLIKRLEGIQGEAVCPTCQQSLNEKDIESLITSCKNDIIYLGFPLCNKSETIRWFGLKGEGLEYKDLEELDKELEEISSKLEFLKLSYSKAKEKEEIENKIKAYPEIENMDKPDFEKLKNLEEKIPVGRTKLEKLNSDLRIRKELDKEEYKGVENFNKLDIEKQIGDMQPKLNSLNEDLMEMNADIRLGEEQNSRFEKISERIAQIEKAIEKMPIYEALIKAYSAKGIRIAQIAYLADMFCNNLNKYSNLVFNKKMKFSVNVDANNFNILAERNGRVSDVSQLSGQESRFFMLLCCLALIPFIPEKLRCDTIILDEVEAGVNEENRRYLINQGFFKVLQNIVKNIVIVTPMSSKEYFIDANQEYYISLKNNTSCIERIK